MNVHSNNTFASILVIDDNPADVRLTREAFAAAKTGNHVYDVPDGYSALAFLRREGEYHDAVCPDLILLDLKLPGMNGREILQAIKKDTSLRHIPVIIFTTSTHWGDIRSCYELQASSYVIKPENFNKMIDIVHEIQHFYFQIVRLPN